MKMNPEIKETWLEALRSGAYKQGTRRLRNENDEYCCLGVLCDILGFEWVEEGVGWGVLGTKDDPHAHSTLPPDEVWKAAGLWNEDAQHGVQMVGGGQNLSGLNDGGMPFEEIADAIEQYL